MSVRPDVVKWLCLVDYNAACGTPVAVEEVLHDAAFAKCVQALCDGGGIDEEAAAEGAADIWIELIERELRLVL